MRARSVSLLLTSLFIASLVLAGCIGGDDDLDADDNAETGALQPLASGIQTTADLGSWFAPGDSIDVEAVAPEGAVGNVTYTWAIQKDPFEVFSEIPEAIDSGELLPGEEWEVTFDEPAFYEFGHCDPHPWMTHTVAVIDGYDGPDELTVYILEGDLADQDSYAFSVGHITVGVGTTVTYVNTGQIMHTASIAHEGEGVPTPTPLGLTEQQGTLTLAGDGWMNLIVFMEDEAGNGGFHKEQIYVREKFPDYAQTESGSFLHTEESSASSKHEFEWSGTVTLNVTLDDPTETVDRVEVELVQLDDGENAVETLISTGSTGTGTFSESFTTTIPRTYELTVRPAQGVAIGWSVDVVVEYDHTPPELVDLPCPEPHYSLGHC